MYYYDATRVTQVSEGVLKFWGKAIPSPEAVKKFVKIDPKFTELDHIISLIEMNCTERKRRSLWIIFYDKNGVVIENVEITHGESDWEIVLPGSAQEDILDALCE
jgi:predicted DNA binding protein